MFNHRQAPGVSGPERGITAALLA